MIWKSCGREYLFFCVGRGDQDQSRSVRVRGHITGHACAQQYVGKSQACMVISGRLIVHAPVRREWVGLCGFAWVVIINTHTHTHTHTHTRARAHTLKEGEKEKGQKEEEAVQEVQDLRDHEQQDGLRVVPQDTGNLYDVPI